MTTLPRAIYLNDKDCYLAYLPTGRYDIGGKIFDIRQNDFYWQDAHKFEPIQVDKEHIHSIKKLYQKEYVSSYVNADTGQTISVEDFEKLKFEIEKLRKRDKDGEFTFKTVEDEFRYEMFFNLWKGLRQEKTFLADEPLKLVITDSVFEANIPYCNPIVHSFDRENENLLYVFHRKEAFFGLVLDKLEELGLEVIDKYTKVDSHIKYCRIDEYDKRKKKVDMHGIRYMRINDNYILKKEWETLCDSIKNYHSTMTDTLARVTEVYEKDKNAVDRILRLSYSEQYEKHKEIPHLSLNILLKRVSAIEGQLSDVKYHAKSRSDFLSLRKNVEKLRVDIEKIILGKEIEGLKEVEGSI